MDARSPASDLTSPPRSRLVKTASKQSRTLPFDPHAWSEIEADVNRAFPEVRAAYYEQTVFNAHSRFSFSFSSWHGNAANCLTYAIGDRRLTLHRLCASSNLGAISGNFFTQSDLTKELALNIALQDGFKATDGRLVIRKEFQSAALFVCEHEDYHLARLSKLPNGKNRWTHKFCRETPTVIYNPNDCGLRNLAETSISFDRPHVALDAHDRPSPHIYKYYDFVSFLLIPNDLSVSVDVIHAHKERIRTATPHRISAWEAHLKKMNVPTSGFVRIPQYG